MCKSAIPAITYLHMRSPLPSVPLAKASSLCVQKPACIMQRGCPSSDHRVWMRNKQAGRYIGERRLVPCQLVCSYTLASQSLSVQPFVSACILCRMSTQCACPLTPAPVPPQIDSWPHCLVINPCCFRECTRLQLTYRALNARCCLLHCCCCCVVLCCGTPQKSWASLGLQHLKALVLGSPPDALSLGPPWTKWPGV